LNEATDLSNAELGFWIKVMAWALGGVIGSVGGLIAIALGFKTLFVKRATEIPVTHGELDASLLLVARASDITQLKQDLNQQRTDFLAHISKINGDVKQLEDYSHRRFHNLGEVVHVQGTRIAEVTETTKSIKETVEELKKESKKNSDRLIRIQTILEASCPIVPKQLTDNAHSEDNVA
jgi:hypothetical protein